MKKVFTLTLSFILCFQHIIAAQTFYPTAKDVEIIYNKIAEKVNSLSSLKQIAKDTNTTPLVVLSAIAPSVSINTKKKFAAFLKELHINVKPDASILDISEAAYRELINQRKAGEVLLNHFGEVYEKAEKLITDAANLEPQILKHCEDYLDVFQKDMIQKELKKLNIQNLGVRLEKLNLNEITDRFIETCDKAGVEVFDFLQAYSNITQLPQESANLITQEKYLTNVVEDFFAYRGEYLALKDIEAAMGSSKKLAELAERYYNEAYNLEYEYSEALDKAAFYLEKQEAQPIESNYKKMLYSQYKAEDLGIKYIESEAKKQTIDNFFLGKSLPQFTKKGGLFIGIIGVFVLADKIIATEKLKKQQTMKIQNVNNLQDMLADNKDNLYAVLELLPVERKTVFNYIAESYFPDFEEQTNNLLFALALIEDKEESLHQKAEQKIKQNIDNSYKAAEQKLQKLNLHL